MAKGERAGRGSDQFPLRLPDGMRDRIKAAADRHQVSMNEEIVNILLRHFPPLTTIEQEVYHLRQVVEVLAGAATAPGVADLADSIRELVREIDRGRVAIDPASRSEVSDRLEKYEEDFIEDAVPPGYELPAGEDE